MGNLGSGEILVILLVALIVLGPTRLPEAARQIGKATQELRRMSGTFQRELKAAIDEPLAETRAVIKGVESTVTGTVTPAEPDAPSDADTPSDTATSEPATPSDTVTSEPATEPTGREGSAPSAAPDTNREAPKPDESDSTEA